MTTIQKAIFTVGVSASGKTTWAKQYVEKNPDTVIVCRDDIRTVLMGGKLDFSKWQWSREDEVTAIQENLIRQAYEAGQSVIIADTNLPVVKDGKVAFSNGEKLAAKLSRMGFVVTWVDFPITLAVAIERDQNRPVSVGETVIRKQMVNYQAWLASQGKRTYTP